MSTLPRVGFYCSGSLLQWHLCLQAKSSEAFEVHFKNTEGAGELVWLCPWRLRSGEEVEETQQSGREIVKATSQSHPSAKDFHEGINKKIIIVNSSASWNSRQKEK